MEETLFMIKPDAVRAKKIGAILGDAAVTHECLLCAGLGFLPDLPPAGTTFSMFHGIDGVMPPPATDDPDPPRSDRRDRPEGGEAGHDPGAPRGIKAE